MNGRVAIGLAIAVAISTLFAIAEEVPPAEATHNRATQLSWRAGPASNEVRFHVNLVARRSFYGAPNPGGTISDPVLVFGDGSSTTPTLKVTAVDVANDIVYAETQSDISHVYGGSGPYTAFLSSCCRISGGTAGHVNNPDGDYRVETIVNLGATSAAPVSLFAPIVDCAKNSLCVFTVPATDADSQGMRWRMATSDEAAGAGNSFTQPGPPFAPSAASIDPVTGRYSWQTTGAQLNPDASRPTFYSTQVMVENVVNGVVVTKSPVDFFIRLSDSAQGSPICSDVDGNGSLDNDNDGLCDNWETTGIDANRDGNVDLVLYDANGDGVVNPSERTDMNVKDIFVEIDFMSGRQPMTQTLSMVASAFANAPEPIVLHLMIGESLDFVEDVIFGPCPGACPPNTASFDDIKVRSFGTPRERGTRNAANVLAAKRFVFHYALWANGLRDRGSTSGIAEIGGNDLIITLGRWAVANGTLDQQAGTFMHELGHNLGLLHGGGDSLNCKPNYISVMNYTRQTKNQYYTDRELDYSRSQLPTLTESALDERLGVQGPAGVKVAHGPQRTGLFGLGRNRVSNADDPIDWNLNFSPFQSGIQSDPVSANVNMIPDTSCDGDGSVLVGYDDWDSIVYAFQSSADFAEGVHSTAFFQDEPEYEDAPAAQLDSDADGVMDADDNCIDVANPAQLDSNADTIGDACGPLRPLGGPFTIGATSGDISVYATGTSDASGTSATVRAVVSGKAFGPMPVTAAGISTVDGKDVFLVRFVVDDQTWEVRFPSGAVGQVRVEVCGPAGCQTGDGVFAPEQNVPPSGLGTYIPPTTSTTAAGTVTTTTAPASSQAVNAPPPPPPVTTTTTTSPPPSSSNAQTGLGDRCPALHAQLSQTSDPRVMAQILIAMQALGCPP